MKLLFSTVEKESKNNFILINDIDTVDILCDDAEAQEIVVDEFLKQFPYRAIGPVIAKIVSKLRIGGTLTIIDQDIDFLSHNFSRGNFSLEQLNELLFAAGSAMSFTTMEVVKDLALQNGLSVESVFINETYSYVLRFKRC